MSWPGMEGLFGRYSQELIFIKNVDDDVVTWCNEAAAKSVGKLARDVIDKPSSASFPSYAEYREDDLNIIESNEPRITFFERIGGTQILTTKIPYHYDGVNYVVIFSLNCTEISERVLEIARKDDPESHGTAYSFEALESAKRTFRAAQIAFERASQIQRGDQGAY